MYLSNLINFIWTREKRVKTERNKVHVWNNLIYKVPSTYQNNFYSKIGSHSINIQSKILIPKKYFTVSSSDFILNMQIHVFGIQLILMKYFTRFCAKYSLRKEENAFTLHCICRFDAAGFVVAGLEHFVEMNILQIIICIKQYV